MPPRWLSSRPLVLVVCTANVCRSPVAAVMLKEALRRGGEKQLCRVISAGTNVASPGRRPDPRMDRLMRQIGLSLRGERARHLTPRLLQQASVVIAMEAKHRDRIRELSSSDNMEPRVYLLGRWLPDSDNRESHDISDPYFANAAAIEKAFDEIRLSIAALAESRFLRRELMLE